MQKKVLSLLTTCFLAILVFSSCKKSKTTTPPSVMSLFTGKQWIPDTIYINYTGPGTGTIVYIRGSNSNVQNYHDADRGIFWADGSEDAFDATGYTQWTWSFENTDSTSFTGNNGSVTNHVRIVNLDATHLTLQDSTYQTYSANVAEQ